MSDIQFKSIGEVIAENRSLRDEALAWHAKANQLEIENKILKEQVKTLAIENVKLLNEPKKDKSRQYDDSMLD